MSKRKNEPDPRPPASDLLPKSRMVTPRPTEVKAIVGLLEEPADDSTDLAKRIISKLDLMRFGKRTYGVIVQLQGENGCGYIVYGPYPTAKRAAEAQKIVENVYPGRSRTATLSNTLSVDDAAVAYYA